MTVDVMPEGVMPGGPVTYAALTAAKMGLRPAIVTSAGPDLDIGATVPGISVHSVPSDHSTTFRMSYVRGRRRQVIESAASPIVLSDVPIGWRSAPLVLLAPVAGEVSEDLAEHFPGSVVMASLQGWLRHWDSAGLVSTGPWAGREVLRHADAAVVSIEDVADTGLIGQWAEDTAALMVTMGSRGARLHFEGAWHQIAPFAVREVEPTGAGDVFAAAYLVRYHQAGDPLESARFAACAASFCVEAIGTSGIPTREQVEERLSGPRP
jgi:hypothetical protein